MMLKGRDGWQFLAERQRDPALARVPVVITTAVRVASSEWARSLGAQAFFRKPIPVTPLLQELRRLLAEAA
jgi:CheY-like chemotaxis protein